MWKHYHSYNTYSVNLVNNYVDKTVPGVWKLSLLISTGSVGWDGGSVYGGLVGSTGILGAFVDGRRLENNTRSDEECYNVILK